MEFSLNPTSRSPLYRQLQDQIRYAISVGELEVGDTLPSIRRLEAELGVNRNTIRRAYLELQIDGTLSIRQGREAVVAARAIPASPGDAVSLLAAADALAAEALRRAEAIGVDSVQLAERLACAAHEHDASYPRCAFLECSPRQAEVLAADAARRLGRAVAPVDLHDLRRSPDAAPASVRVVLTPHWHVAEAMELIDTDHRSVHAVGVRISDECGSRLRALSGAIGLIVRDEESVPGYRERLRQHLGAGEIGTAVLKERAGVKALLRRVDHVVYTSPCAEAVRELAPDRVGLHELLFETMPDDLRTIKSRIFPLVVQEEQTDQSEWSPVQEPA